MTLQTVLLFLLGVVYGLIVGRIGQKILDSSAIKAPPRNDNEVRIMTRRVITRWWLKLLLDAVALFVLYHWVPMLLGAALGILVSQKLFIVKSIKG